MNFLPTNGLVVIAVIWFVFSVTADAQPSSGFQSVSIRDGTLYFEDGSEVALWGVNFQAASSAEYELMQARQLFRPFIYSEYQQMIKESFDELELLGVEIIRLTLSAGDFADAEANLVENDWLRSLDFIMKEAQRRGIYIYLALHDHDSEGAIEDSFVRRFKGEEILFVEAAQQLIKRYFKQLLNRSNPYDGNRRYKDNPALLILEPLHHPACPTREDVRLHCPSVEQLYQGWLKQSQYEDTEKNFKEFRQTHTHDFIKQMIHFFQKEKVKMAMSWDLGEMAGKEADTTEAFQAFWDSGNRLYSFSFYPGREMLQERGGRTGYLGENNYLPFFKECMLEGHFLGWQLEERFRRHHARIVSGFEAVANHNPAAYPAMAHLFRSLGVQVATQWSYRPSGYARYFSGPYNFNLKTTPRKAAGFMVAGKIFKRVPRFAPYHTTETDGDIKDYGFYSFSRAASAYAGNDMLIYAGKTQAVDVPVADKLRYIAGSGSSPIVQYEGEGLVRIEYFGKDLKPLKGNFLNNFRSMVFRKLKKEPVYNWKLTVLPDLVRKTEPWSSQPYLSLEEPLVDYTTSESRQMTIRLPGGVVYAVARIDGSKRESIVVADSPEGQIFEVHPGNYELAVELPEK